MTTTLSPPIKLAPYLWRYEWTGTAPFRVFDYWDYKYLKTNTTDTRIDVLSYYENQPNPIQVLDSTEGSIDGDIYPGSIRIQWRGMPNIDYYQISILSGLLVFSSIKETGAGYYQYTFQYPYNLTVSQTGSVDVICYDIEGNSKTLTIPTIPVAMFNVNEALRLDYDSGTTTLTIAPL